MKIKETINEHDIPVSHHTCDTCGVDYTITRAVEDGTPLSKNCMADNCESYDPDNDVDIMFMTDEEIAREKPLISMKMLRKRKEGFQIDKQT